MKDIPLGLKYVGFCILLYTIIIIAVQIYITIK